jgi:acetyl-CoA hydrolase
VRTVVTEYGVAELHGRTVAERALALIAVAHPDFRDDLLAEARKTHYL